MTGPDQARPLLVVDGDSFAHRAYHAIPKSVRGAGGRPANALVGVSNFLLRLWDSVRPAAVAGVPAEGQAAA